MRLRVVVLKQTDHGANTSANQSRALEGNDGNVVSVASMVDDVLCAVMLASALA